MQNESISRRTMLGCLGGAASMAMSGCASVQATTSADDSKPNVVLILADDHHFRALGAAGNPEIHTPNLDRLARQGTRFTNCHVTNPICTPSRATILTGQYGFRNGVVFFGQPIREQSITWPQLLKQQGYTLGYTGKWHNNKRPSDFGFDVMKHTFLGGMYWFHSIEVVDREDDQKRIIDRNPTEVFGEAAVDFVMSNPDKPFGLFLSFTAPHDPRHPPEEYEVLYPPESISLPENFMQEPKFDPLTLTIRDERLEDRPFDPTEIRREIGRYYAMITHMDDQIGLLVNALEKTGQIDNTYILFAGDNGLALGSHGLLGKQTMYEEGLRVPLIVHGPGVQQGKTCDALVDLMDLMPSICDIGGAPLPDNVDGMSLKPLWEGRRIRERDSHFCHYEDLFRMVKDDRYKYIRHLRTGREELFDLQQDPYELNDLVESTDHRVIRERLRVTMSNWQTRVLDTGTRNPAPVEHL